MFVLIVGGGKVGLNTARQLLRLGHEIALVEDRRLEALGDQIAGEAGAHAAAADNQNVHGPPFMTSWMSRRSCPWRACRGRASGLSWLMARRGEQPNPPKDNP